MIIKISVIAFSAIAFCLPVNAQLPSTDFSQMNSSRKFFDRGNEQMEREIKLLQDKPLLEIKLLDNSSISPNSGDDFLNTEANIKSDSQTAIDRSEQN